MHLLFFHSAVIISVSGGFLPQYNDPIYGKLVVSRRHPPFLTLKKYPDREYYLPTDKQVREIRSAIYGGFNRFHRHWVSNSTSDVMQLRFKRSMDEDDDEVKGISGEKLSLSSKAFEEGMETFDLYSKDVGKMIISMFKAYIGKEPMPDPKIPFKSFNETTHFKAGILHTAKMTTWLDDLRVILQLHAPERSDLPINKVLSKLKECRSDGSSEVAYRDYKFNSEKGGTMTYYKVQCHRIGTDMFVFFALNNNDFKLKPEKMDFVDNCEKSHVDGKECKIDCWLPEKSPKFSIQPKSITLELKRLKDKILRDKCPSAHDQASNETMTVAQEGELKDYLIDKIVQRVKIDFQDKIDAANEEFVN